MQVSSHNLDKPWFGWGARRWRQIQGHLQHQHKSPSFLPKLVTAGCMATRTNTQHLPTTCLVCFDGENGPNYGFGVKGVSTHQVLCLAFPFKVV